MALGIRRPEEQNAWGEHSSSRTENLREKLAGALGRFTARLAVRREERQTWVDDQIERARVGANRETQSRVNLALAEQQRHTRGQIRLGW